MATRSLMALDHANYQTNSILKKHAKNRPLGDIEHRHGYIPSQPVLSCRTVNIDLPGTRTYRPKSTVDILEEQQRLIRSIYNKQRASTSAPPRQRPEAVPRSSSEHSIRRVNIEVKGRPLTSLSNPAYQGEAKTSAGTRRRPKTTGRLKNVQPATDCFMVIKVDRDLVTTSQNNRELTNKLQSYWKSENNNLAVGKFVRGQKRPDDVPPTLDAWLTFGGASGDHSEGVIDAFASFKNSEEYYNIEGSVGSRVAQQLQKGDKIRIGINGILQSQDLKVKKWNKDYKQEETVAVEDEPEREETFEEIVEETGEITQEEVEQGREEEIQTPDEIDAVEEPVDNTYDDFKELMVGGLDDLLEDSMEIEKEPSPRPKAIPPPKAPVAVARQKVEEPVVTEKPRKPGKTIPLSWDDQCTKDDVKVIHATVSPREVVRPVMSETHPVRFEKLINGGSRPRLAQAKPDGYRVKQRSAKGSRDGPGSAKVKVVYIDPLTQEQEEKVNEMSVDEIVNFKLEGRSRENTTTPAMHRNLREYNDNAIVAINDDTGPSFRPKRVSSTKSSSKSSRPTSNYSVYSERGNVPSPKLKTAPVHSSASHGPAKLGIISAGARHTPPINEMPRLVKTPGKITPSKPLHRTGAGQGSSIKAGPLQGETEYIKITTQLKFSSANVPASLPMHHSPSFNPYPYTPGSNTPRDEDYQADVYEPKAMSPKSPSSIDNEQPSNSNNKPLSREQTPVQNNDINEDIKNNENNEDYANNTRASSALSDSPAPTTVAISIPTADELSDKESPTTSPPRHMNKDGLTSMQRRARNMRDEQIDQITDLLGGAIVES